METGCQFSCFAHFYINYNGSPENYSVFNIKESFEKLDEARNIIDNGKIVQIPMEYQINNIEWNGRISSSSTEKGINPEVNAPTYHQLDLLERLGNPDMKLNEYFNKDINASDISSAMLQEKMNEDKELTHYLDNIYQEIVEHASICNDHVIVIDKMDRDTDIWVNNFEDEYSLLLNNSTIHEYTNNKFDVSITVERDEITGWADIRVCAEDKVMKDLINVSEKDADLPKFLCIDNFFPSSHSQGHTQHIAEVSYENLNKLADKCFDVAHEHTLDHAERETEKEVDIDIKR